MVRDFDKCMKFRFETGVAKIIRLLLQEKADYFQ